MANLPYKTRALIWIGNSKDELSSFPPAVKRVFGFALRLVQNGEMPEIAKPLTGLGRGVYELKDNADRRTFRVVYVVKLKKGVYVVAHKEVETRKQNPQGRKGEIGEAHSVRAQSG